MKILGGNPRRPRRGGRRNRLPPSSHRSFESGTDIGTSPRIQDTGYDAAIARKLLDEERLALKSSNHERSSHQRNPPLAPPFVPDTSADYRSWQTCGGRSPRAPPDQCTDPCQWSDLVTNDLQFHLDPSRMAWNDLPSSTIYSSAWTQT
jgi:hypothetical protein